MQERAAAAPLQDSPAEGEDLITSLGGGSLPCPALPSSQHFVRLQRWRTGTSQNFKDSENQSQEPNY